MTGKESYISCSLTLLLLSFQAREHEGSGGVLVQLPVIRASAPAQRVYRLSQTTRAAAPPSVGRLDR